MYRIITGWQSIEYCQALAPNPLVPKPKNPKKPKKGPWTYTKIIWATTPPHPITFKHEGGVPQQNPKSKTYSE